MRYPDCGVGEVVAALARDGAVVIRNAVEPAVCEKLIEEMTPYVDAYPKVVRSQLLRMSQNLAETRFVLSCSIHVFSCSLLDE